MSNNDPMMMFALGAVAVLFWMGRNVSPPARPDFPQQHKIPGVVRDGIRDPNEYLLRHEQVRQGLPMTWYG